MLVGRHAKLDYRIVKRSPGSSVAAEAIEVALLAVCQAAAALAAASILVMVVLQEAVLAADRSTLPTWVTLIILVGVMELC